MEKNFSSQWKKADWRGEKNRLKGLQRLQWIVLENGFVGPQLLSFINEFISDMGWVGWVLCSVYIYFTDNLSSDEMIELLWMLSFSLKRMEVFDHSVCLSFNALGVALQCRAWFDLISFGSSCKGSGASCVPFKTSNQIYAFMIYLYFSFRSFYSYNESSFHWYITDFFLAFSL